MPSTGFFIENRKRLSEMTENGLIVVAANELMQRNSDCVFPFRQDSNFYYLTGITEPGIVLVMDLNASTEFLILPHKTKAEIVFGGSINCDEIAKIQAYQVSSNIKMVGLSLRSCNKIAKKYTRYCRHQQK